MVSPEFRRALQSSYFKNLQHLVAVVVDNLDGDFAAGRFREGPVACEQTLYRRRRTHQRPQISSVRLKISWFIANPITARLSWNFKMSPTWTPSRNSGLCSSMSYASEIYVFTLNRTLLTSDHKEGHRMPQGSQAIL